MSLQAVLPYRPETSRLLDRVSVGRASSQFDAVPDTVAAMEDAVSASAMTTLLPSTSGAAWTSTMIHDHAVALRDRLIEHRRTIHRHPELAWCEHRTASYIE